MARGAHAARRRELGYETQPYCVIIGGGQGGIALGARLRAAGRAHDHHREQRAAGRLLAQALQVAVPARSGVVRPPALHQVPRHWPVFSPKDKIGDWLEMYTRVMELNYWGSTTAKRARYDEDSGEWIVTVERDGAEVTLRPKQLVMATGMSGARIARDPRGGHVQGRPASLLAAPRAGRLSRQASGRDRLQQLRPRHLRRPVGARRRRHDGAAVVDARRRSETLMELALGAALLRAGGRERA